MGTQDETWCNQTEDAAFGQRVPIGHPCLETFPRERGV